MALVVTAVVVTGLSVLLLHRASSAAPVSGARYPSEQRAEYLRGRKDGYLRVLHTLSYAMGHYETIPAPQRRDIFDALLHRTVMYEQTMIALYTVWKPDALDGMDAGFTARLGSCPMTGQYASAFTRETGEVLQQFTSGLEDIMVFLSGPYSRDERIEQLTAAADDAGDTSLFRLTVPIINPRTNEVVGGVGGVLAVMFSAEEYYVPAGAHGMTNYTIILAVFSVIVSALIIVVVVVFITRPIVIITEAFKDISGYSTRN